MGLMVLVGLLGKFGSTAAVVVLGFKLSDDDFGLFGIALGFGGVVQVLRDGGLRQIAIQRGPKGFERLLGPVGWMSLAANSTAGLILAALAPLAAVVYGEPDLLGLMLVTAVAAPLVTVGSLCKADLEVQLRYGAVAWMNTSNNMTRYGAQIVLAVLGFGAYAMVIPMILVSIVDGIVGLSLTRRTFLTHGPRTRIWPTLLSRVRWTIGGTLGLAVLNRADRIVLGFFVPTAVVGLYTFAFQIAIQINTILAANFQKVLFPALTRFKDDQNRHTDATARALRALSLVSAGGGVALALAFRPLEHLIWQGKWQAAVPAAQLMALALPMRMCVSIHNAAALSLGQFKPWAFFNWIQGAGLVIAAALAGWLAASAGDGGAAATAIAAVISLFYALAIPLLVARRLTTIDLPLGTTLAAIFGPWITMIAAALLVSAARHALITPAGQPDRQAAAIDLAITLAAYSALAAAASRCVLKRPMIELLAVTPAPLSKPAARAFRLPHAHDQQGRKTVPTETDATTTGP